MDSENQRLYFPTTLQAIIAKTMNGDKISRFSPCIPVLKACLVITAIWKIMFSQVK
jgi:phage terminase large subunit-like protein